MAGESALALELSCRYLTPLLDIAGRAGLNGRLEQLAAEWRVTVRELRDADVDASLRAGAAFHPGAVGPEDRLFNEEDSALAREAAHQVLRTLEDEVPAQVRENGEIHAAKMRVTVGPVVTKEKCVTQTL